MSTLEFYNNVLFTLKKLDIGKNFSFFVNGESGGIGHKTASTMALPLLIFRWWR
jgi:hypothetical protein